jgi:mannose-6-phosphate isomerase-like protein (cupin superfamily)
MQRKHVRFGRGFRVLMGNRRVQAASMTIAPGGKEGGPGNRHRGADQWLFVVEGKGRAFIKGQSLPLNPGTLLLIAHGDRHEIRNTGRALLKTLNFYSPPAYTAAGHELPAGRRR